MDSHGKLFADGEMKAKSKLLAEYDQLVKDKFSGLDRFSDDDLDWLQRIHDKHLELYKEERRMHFGAFALKESMIIENVRRLRAES